MEGERRREREGGRGAEGERRRERDVGRGRGTAGGGRTERHLRQEARRGHGVRDRRYARLRNGARPSVPWRGWLLGLRRGEWEDADVFASW
jgi:hypothetical protein